MAHLIFIDGEAGTTGLQIRERLEHRPDITLLQLDETLRKNAKARKEALNAADIAILCLPDEAAIEAAGMIENDMTVVIDASSAHRTHPDWQYGFAELSPEQPEKIATAKRISNPGCYPQGMIACIRPLIEAGLLTPETPVTVNAISGYSGGGRQKVEQYENPANEKINTANPYALTLAHKHVPEMQLYGKLTHTPIFQPVITSFRQGMVVSMPIFSGLAGKSFTRKNLHDCLSERYRNEQFVRVASLEETDELREIDAQQHNNSNDMTLYVFGNDMRGHYVLSAVYDNLGKGASGSAVQNLDLLLNA